ncbi:hypothetical protein LCM20_13450 [Halobacillus litoralis]|uniref:hypothetical protein n=1 Tax=Halobacillus litoralis TaxID=45668 RepID=UPI001CD221C0|nr:hypothetical protein [Halobacillus litoralis]MCA0971607.1 hypothetical protein [Halobacillus litoralis]
MEYVSFGMSLALLFYIGYRNRNVINKLTHLQLATALLGYLVTVSIGFVFIYYGGNWLAGVFSNVVIKYGVFVSVVLVTLYVCKGLLGKWLHKATGGVLPKEWR